MYIFLPIVCDIHHPKGAAHTYSSPPHEAHSEDKDARHPEEDDDR
jgi:hypothetical protein